jgi:flagellar L-ring protein precursor FlgH
VKVQNQNKFAGGFLSAVAAYLLSAVCWLVAGCSTSTPPTSIHQPMTARPANQLVVSPSDGAIYRAGVSEHPMFEDVRARNVGDTLTINVAETTTGVRSTTGGSASSNSIASGTPGVTVGTAALATMLKPINMNGSNSNKSATSGSGAASQALTGTITVTVIEVLGNGNLLVSGEKQVALTNSNDFIRFSGVINPVFIVNNTVQSGQVADVHIEYKNAGEMNQVLNDAQSLGFLGRFFMSVLPF